MARGGGTVTHARLPDRSNIPNPLAVFAQEISKLPAQMQQQAYMRMLTQQQEAAAAEAASGEQRMNAMGADAAERLRQFEAWRSGQGQGPQAGAVTQTQAGPGPGSINRPIMTQTQGLDGQMVGERGRLPPPQAAAGAAPSAPPQIRQTPMGQVGAVAPWDEASLRQWQGQDRTAMNALGDARVGSGAALRGRESADRAALGVVKNLEPSMEREWKAHALEATRAMLVDLPPEERRVQEAAIDAAAQMIRAGVNDQAVDGILQHTHPNVRQRAQTARDTAEIAKMANEGQADAAATPLYLAELARAADPQTAEELQRLAQIPGFVVWGAGKGLTDLVSGREETNRFRSNADRSHSQKMTQIQTETAGFASNRGIDPVRSVLETANNYRRFGVAEPGQMGPNGQPARRPVEFAEALEIAIRESRTAAPGIFTPQVEAEIRGQDAQVLSDVSYYAEDESLTPETWPILARQLAAERTPDQIRDLRQRLQEGWGARTLTQPDPFRITPQRR